MSSPVRGTIHGTTIELDKALGLPDGQTVEVTVEIVPSTPNDKVVGIETLRRAAGSWSDDDEGLDRFLEWNRLDRKAGSRKLPE